MRIYEAAALALRDLGRPSHLRDIHAQVVRSGTFHFGAVDPVRALGVQIDRHAKGVLLSNVSTELIFYRERPATYGLLEWLDAETVRDILLDSDIQAEAETEALDASLFLEQELQRWLFKNWEKTQLTALGFGPLTLYAPEEQRLKSGKFNTATVGEMDFLFRTPEGDLLVCELKRHSSDQTIGQLCRYWGWASETIGKSTRVFGLVLAREISESLRLAIKATHPDISYRELVLEVTLGPALR